MTNTIFSKIIAGEFNTDFIYEDESCVVFKDINPKAKTHLLVVPRKPITSVIDMEQEDEKLVGHLIFVCRKVAEKLGLKGYNLKINCGKEGGQEVFHLHIHLMSKY